MQDHIVCFILGSNPDVGSSCFFLYRIYCGPFKCAGNIIFDGENYRDLIGYVHKTSLEGIAVTIRYLDGKFSNNLKNHSLNLIYIKFSEHGEVKIVSLNQPGKIFYLCFSPTL